MTDPKSFEPPKARCIASVHKVGEERPPTDISLIPALVGDVHRIAFRADRKTCDDIERHLDRLANRAPGVVISVSDAVRSLLQRGAAAFDQEDK